MKSNNKKVKSKKIKTEKQKAYDIKCLVDNANNLTDAISSVSQSVTEIQDCYVSELIKVSELSFSTKSAASQVLEKYVSDEWESDSTHSKRYKSLT